MGFCMTEPLLRAVTWGSGGDHVMIRLGAHDSEHVHPSFKDHAGAAWPRLPDSTTDATLVRR